MSESIMRLFAIALGGAVGAVARYGIGVACVTAWGARFAYGTLIVNVAGCFLLGLLMHEAWLPADRSGVHWHAGVAVGLLGGLTTFSTFGYQTIRHIEAGQPLLAIGNVALNVILGLIAAGAGLMVSRAIWPAA